MKNRLYIFGFLVLFLVSACDRQKPGDFLKIGSQWFSSDEFYSQTPRYSFKYLTADQQNDKIEHFIDQQMLVHYAIKNNYQRLPSVRRRIRLLEKQFLINEYFDRTILDSVVTKQRLLAEYESLDPYKQDLFTFNDYKSILKENLIRRYSKDIRAMYLNEIELLKQTNKFKLNQSNIDSLSKLFMTTLISLRHDSTSHQTTDILKMIPFDRPLYEINDQSVYLNKFIDLLSEFPFISPDERFSDPQSLSRVIETVAMNSSIYYQAKHQKMDKSDDFKKHLLFQKHTILYQTAFSKKITSTISINDDTLRNFYSDHRDSSYMTRRRFEVQEIYISDKSKASNILKRALQHEDFQKLADTYTERYQNKPRKGYLGFIYQNTYADIGRCAAKTGAGQIYPELVMSGKGFSIIKVLSIDEPKPIPYDEIKGKVLDDCKKAKINRRKAELLDSLKHKYSYYVDRSALFNK